MIERVVGQPLLSSLLLTFGLSTLFMGTALSLWTANFRSVPYLTGSVSVLGIDLSQTRLVAFAIALALTALTYSSCASPPLAKRSAPRRRTPKWLRSAASTWGRCGW